MAKVMLTARIEAEQNEFLTNLGNGDRTLGLRALIVAAMTDRHNPTKPYKEPAAPQLKPVARRPMAPAHPGYTQAKAQEIAGAPLATPARKTGFIGRR